MKLSIIIPTYNRCKLLGEALDSILLQSVTPYEVLVCDDFSSDNTLTYVQARQNDFKQREILLKVFPAESNSGAQVARNRGWNESTGDTLLFMDSDDILADHALHAIQMAFSEQNYDYVYGIVTIQTII